MGPAHLSSSALVLEWRERRDCRSRLRGGFLAGFLVRVGVKRSGLSLHHVGSDHYFLHARKRGQLEHSLEEDALQDGTKAPRAGLALDRLLGDGVKRLFLEAKLDAFHL